MGSEKIQGGWPNGENCLQKGNFKPFTQFDPQTCRYSVSLLKFLKALVQKQ